MKVTVLDGESSIAVVDSTEARHDEPTINSAGRVKPLIDWLSGDEHYKPWGRCDYGNCPHEATTTVADPHPDTRAHERRRMCATCGSRFPQAA